MSVIGVVTVRVTQTDIDAQVDLVVLRIPPARVDDLICVRRGIYWTVRNAIIHAIMTIVIDPVPQAVGPVPTLARVADSGPWRRCSRWRWRWTILVGYIACISHDAVVEGIDWSGMVEDRFLRS